MKRAALRPPSHNITSKKKRLLLRVGSAHRYLRFTALHFPDDEA
jgi:hypothetical protein